MTTAVAEEPRPDQKTRQESDVLSEGPRLDALKKKIDAHTANLRKIRQSATESIRQSEESIQKAKSIVGFTIG